MTIQEAMIQAQAMWPYALGLGVFLLGTTLQQVLWPVHGKQGPR